MNDERIEAFSPRALVTKQPGSELAGEGRGKTRRMFPSLVRWMQALLPSGGGAAGVAGAPVGESWGPGFDRCVDGECGECERRRQAQQAEDVAVWGLLVACLVGFGAAAVSQIWRVL